MDTLQTQFSHLFLHKVTFFFCSYESWESEDFKTILTYTHGCYQTKVMSHQILMVISLLTTCINNQSFWAVLTSKLLSCFLAYLRQFKSKSHIQRHHWKAEIQGFHLAPSIMGLQALLMEIWALKKAPGLLAAPVLLLQTDLIFCLQERKKSWTRVSQSNL